MALCELTSGESGSGARRSSVALSGRRLVTPPPQGCTGYDLRVTGSFLLVLSILRKGSARSDRGILESHVYLHLFNLVLVKVNRK